MSASGGTATLRADGFRSDLVGAHCLANQDCEGRNVVVPFDQGRLRSEATNRVGVEVPGGPGDWGCVRVDQYLRAGFCVVFLGRKASKMQLADRVCRQAVDVLVGVIAHVVGAEVDIADVTQQSTARSPHELGEKFD